MASSTALRTTLKLFLKKNPSLRIQGKWLFRPPIKFALSGLYFEGSSNKNLIHHMRWVIPLSRPVPVYCVGYGKKLYISENRQIVEGHNSRLSDPISEHAASLLDFSNQNYAVTFEKLFEKELSSLLENSRELSSNIDLVLKFNQEPKTLMVGWAKLLFGDFRAAKLLYQESLDFSAKHNLTGYFKGIQECLSVIETGNKARIADYLHLIEEKHVDHFGLREWWQPAPFPFEAQ